MKNFLLIFFLLGLFISNISAQKVQVGLVAGPVMTTSNRSNVSLSGPDSIGNHTNTLKRQFSFFGGVVVSIPLGKSLVFKPQLEYITKGWGLHHDFDYQEDFDTKLISHWIELPLNFLYTVPAKNGRFFFGLGPYVACALSGKINDDREGRDKTIEFKKNDSSGTVTANRIDVGANIIAGYEFRNGIFISLNYSHGFIDFRNDLDVVRNPKNQNITTGLGIGYMFK